jgi:hypothetical protein
MKGRMTEKGELDSCSRIAPKKFTGRNDKLFFSRHSRESGNPENINEKILCLYTCQ